MKYELVKYSPYVFIVLAVMLPLLLPGYILTLDMIFTPNLPLPQAVTSSYLLHAGLHFLNLIVPSDVLQKIMLLAVLLLSAIGMHRLIQFAVPKIPLSIGLYVASVFYAINPFTYSRFMAGQYSVLLGYALLPWFTKVLLDFTRQPNLNAALKMGALATATGIVSIHAVGVIAVIALAGLTIAVWQGKNIAGLIRYGLVAAGLFVLLSSYWLVPIVLGQGKTAATMASFSAADSQAFATSGGSWVGRAGNVLRLQGFWAEARNMYWLPQAKTVLWGTMALAVTVLVIAGAVNLYAQSSQLVVLFAACGIAGLLVAVFGVNGVLGYREPHKFAMLVALSYSFFLAFGINAFLARLNRHSRPDRESSNKNRILFCWVPAFAGMTRVRYALGAIAVILLPILLTRVMFWGFNGQLKPRQYPADWFSVNSQIMRDDSDFKALFLPWHQYMSFGFSGRIIANPATNFFGIKIIASTDPEFKGSSGGRQDSTHKTIQKALGVKDPNLADVLADQNVKYILLAKDLDYRTYDYVGHMPNLKLVKNYSSIQVYQNKQWRVNK